MTDSDVCEIPEVAASRFSKFEVVRFLFDRLNIVQKDTRRSEEFYSEYIIKYEKNVRLLKEITRQK